MASLNRCTFIGNVGRIETRHVSNGGSVTNIGLACTETWKDKDGSKQEKCVWVNCVLFKKLSEIAEQYVGKGMLLYISGKLDNNPWKDKDGNARTTTQIIVDEMQMLGGKKEPARADEEPAKVKQPGSLAEFDSDLPF